MSLPKSLLTTVLIFAAVWGLLVWKNAPLIEEQATLAENPAGTNIQSSDGVNPTVENAVKTDPPITLVGIKKRVSLGGMGEINQHWQAFYELNELHGAISNQVSGKVYGYYRALDDSFNRAELTVGYNSQSVAVNDFEVLETLDFEQFETIMANSKSWDTTPAWNAIDSSRAVVAVLEEYVMAPGGNVTSTNVYVHYE